MKPRACAIIVDHAARRVLLIHRWRAGQEYYVLPGGKVEAGETLAEALRRELSEELGVKIAVGEPLGSYRHAYTHFKVTVHTFIATIVEGDPKPLQSEQVEWVAISRLGEYPMGKVDRQISIDLNATAKKTCG